jgi:hypothetical protein
VDKVWKHLGELHIAAVEVDAGVQIITALQPRPPRLALALAALSGCSSRSS